ncbi:hypothetical protein H0H93_010164 [Arthromyces matolae]|nr:hypothetical protein H0H93_010164 [Arthromyces matolae]
MAQTEMYYDSIDGLIHIMKSALDAEKSPSNGKVFFMYELSAYNDMYPLLTALTRLPVSKVTLDIICETAFGYKTDSLHDPHNELAEAYEQLIGLQSGWGAKIALIMSIPGAAKLISSKWAYHHRHWFQKIEFFRAAGDLIDCMYRIKRISSEILRQKMEDSAVLVSDTDGKKDIMSILVRARNAELVKDRTVYAMSDQAMMDQVTLWLIANNLDAQKRLREEVVPVFEHSPHPDYRSLKDLEWLDCVIMESLRLLPPVPLTVRVTTKDDIVDGVRLPKGTMLTIPIRVVNTWKVVWGEDAEE